MRRSAVDLVGLHHLGDDRQPGLVARLGQNPQALLAQPLEGYGDVRGLNAPPRSS